MYRLRIGLGVAAVFLVLDQASKWLLIHRVMQPPRVIEIAPVLNIVLAWNRGVSFGLFSDNPDAGSWLFIAVAAIIVTLLLIWLWRSSDRLHSAAIGLIVGGALGNVVDRLHYGAVTDFLDFHVGAWHWPAFNLADSAITVGVALLLYDALFRSRRSDIE